MCVDQINNSMMEQLTKDVARYIIPFKINADWVSFRHPDYSFNSASLQEGRFNCPGAMAFYAASGDYCGQFEVPDYYKRIPCTIKPQTINLFDLPKFAQDYDHNGTFVKQRNDGGWDICQKLANYLTTNYAVSGVLYQSAACHKEGQIGYCFAVLLGQDQALGDDFFIPRTTRS